MPTTVVDRDRLLAIVGRPLSDSVLDELLFASKAEIEGHDGSSLTISLPALSVTTIDIH